jgi:hypothetical protein
MVKRAEPQQAAYERNPDWICRLEGASFRLSACGNGRIYR